jgi:hypothetical protein
VRRLAPAGAAILLLCAACGGSSARQFAAASLPRIVLQPADVPSWTRFENDSGTAADTGSLGSRDRIGVWIARYRSSQGVVVSRIDLYRSAGAAHDAFKRLGTQAVGNGVAPLPTPPHLGDERVGYTVGTTLIFDSIFWRRANAVLSVVLQEPDAKAGEASRLAEQEDARALTALG